MFRGLIHRMYCTTITVIHHSLSCISAIIISDTKPRTIKFPSRQTLLWETHLFPPQYMSTENWRYLFNNYVNLTTVRIEKQLYSTLDVRVWRLVNECCVLTRLWMGRVELTPTSHLVCNNTKVRSRLMGQSVRAIYIHLRDVFTRISYNVTLVTLVPRNDSATICGR